MSLCTTLGTVLGIVVILVRREVGFADTDKLGFEVGFKVGFDVGSRVGCTLGWLLGSLLCCELGPPLGLADEVGALEADEEGSRLGC